TEVERFGRLLAGRRFTAAAFAAAFLRSFFEARFDEAEGGRVDFVVGPVVGDEGAIAEDRQAAVEVHVFAFRVTVGLDRQGQFGQARLAGRLERAGEVDLHVPGFVAFGFDVHREGDFAAFDAFEGGAFDHLLGIFAAAATASTAGAEDGGQGREGSEQEDRTFTAQGFGLLRFGNGQDEIPLYGLFTEAAFQRFFRRRGLFVRGDAGGEGQEQGAEHDQGD